MPATREYWCETHGYKTHLHASMKDASIAHCDECGDLMERFYGTPPLWHFAGTLSASGGIPPSQSGDRAEYSGWQREAWKKFDEDVHPDNRGKTVVTEESWAPKPRLNAVKEKRNAARRTPKPERSA